jgi:type I restriction enzyme M protein
MKKFNEEEMKNLQSVNNKIWSIFEELKNAHVSTEDYHILLFLLSLYKDGLLDERKFEETKDSIYKISNRLKPALDSQLIKYESIFPIFLPVVEFLSPETRKKIIQQIHEIDRQFLASHFEKIFDQILHHITHSRYSSVGNDLQMAEISNLMFEVGNIKKGESIFNPFAGLASFALFSKNGNQYFGQEINRRAWALGKLRLIAFGKFENTEYVCEDSISNWPDKSQKFDVVITSPPIGKDLSSKYIKGQFINTYKTAEQFVIEKSLDILSDSGKLIICVTNGFLNRMEGEEHIIRYLIDNDLLDAIIPFQKHSSMSSAVLVISKNKEYPGKVRMYNTSKFLHKKNEWETEFKFDQLFDFIVENKKDDEVLKFVGKEELSENDFILHVPRYFQPKIEGVQLGDFVERIKGERLNTPQTGKLIRTRDLKESNIDFFIDLSKVEETELNRSDLSKITDSCLLLATRWTSLKPSFFNYNGTPLYKSNDILALKIDKSKVDLAYLINELSADYVVNQLESVRMGSVIPYLRIADLLEIRIKLPSLKEQKAKALGALSAYKDSRFKESKLEDELNFLKAKFNEELREKQHCIRQHLKNVVDSIAVINSFMDKQNGTINRNDVINPNRNVTVAQRFEAMSNSIQSLSLEIDNLTNDELYDKPEIIGIRDIISECILEFGDTKGFSILESFDEFVLDEYGDNNPKFSVSKRSFKELFNNIVINASLHGFIDKKESVIKISVTIEEGKLKVTFLNNGKPLAVGMREHLGVKGKKAGVNAGSGIGVSKVIGIANHYGFEYRIIDLPEDEYPFGWEFKFTLTELN